MEDSEEPGAYPATLFLEPVRKAKGLEVGLLHQVGRLIRMARELHRHAKDGVEVLQREFFKLLPLQASLPEGFNARKALSSLIRRVLATVVATDRTARPGDGTRGGTMRIVLDPVWFH